PCRKAVSWNRIYHYPAARSVVFHLRHDLPYSKIKLLAVVDPSDRAGTACSLADAASRRAETWKSSGFGDYRKWSPGRCPSAPQIAPGHKDRAKPAVTAYPSINKYPLTFNLIFPRTLGYSTRRSSKATSSDRLRPSAVGLAPLWTRMFRSFWRPFTSFHNETFEPSRRYLVMSMPTSLL